MNHAIIVANCRLVTALTEGYKQEFADVYVNDGKITRITPPSTGAPLEANSSTVIHADGKTLLPGFFDLHTHLSSYSLDDSALQLASDGEVMFGAYNFAQHYLRAGYTTLRDCGSTRNSAAEVKKAFAQGIGQGPKIFSAGLIITPTEVGNESYADMYSEADGDDEVRKACRREFKAGNDLIKLMVSGAFLNEGSDPEQVIATNEEIAACVETAAMKGAFVAAHSHGSEAIKRAIRGGVRTIDHGTLIDDEGISMLKDSTDTYLVPTGSVVETCMDQAHLMSEHMREKNQKYYDIEQARIHNAYQAGLVIGFGSDIDMVTFLAKPGLEFTIRKTYYGFDDLEILKQATIYSAIIMGIDDRVGTIAVGKNADLVLIDGSPDKDVFVMQKTPALVLKDGVPVRQLTHHE